MTTTYEESSKDYDVCDDCGKKCYGDEQNDMIEVLKPDGYHLLCEDCHAYWANETQEGTI